MFSGIAMTHAMDPLQWLHVVEGRSVQVTEMTLLVRIALSTSFGPVLLDPFALAVVPLRDVACILRFLALELLVFISTPG